MSFAFFCKLNQAFGIILLGILFGVMGFAATIEVKDLDLWLHMQMGQYIVSHGVVPGFDVLSASGQGLPWVNHEWLFQVVVYLVKSTWGMDGLIYMQVCVVLATCLILLLLTYHQDRQLLSVVMLTLLLFVYQTRFTIRPDLFSFLFFASFIYILSSRLGERWSLPALIVLQILWTNMHGYFFLGIVFILIGIVSEAIKRRIPLPMGWSEEGRLTDDEYRRLRWAFVLLALATCINPLGIQGALYPLNVLKAITGESKIFFNNITELQLPINSANLTIMSDQWPLRFLIGISFLSFLFNRRRIDISALFFWAFFLFFGLSALRNMVYFAIAAYLVTMVNASNLKMTALIPFKAVADDFVQITGTIIKILLIFYLLNYGEGLSFQGYYDFNKYERKSEFLGVSLHAFPSRAADFLKDNGIKGRFFNDFNSGAYLIGRVYPDVLVYMDGRTELRGPKFFEKYRKVWDEGNEKVFDDEVNRLALTGAFVNTVQGVAPEPFLKMLVNKKDYKVVYFDYDAIIFLKDIPQNSDYIRKFAIDLSKWEPKKVDLRRLGPALISPYQNGARASSLLGMGYGDQAMAEADAALEVDPTYSLPYRIKGRIYAERKDWENAFRSYRIVLASSQDDIRLRNKLAWAYLHLGEFDYAIKEAKKMIERAPDDPAGYFMTAKGLIKKKEYKEAYDIVLQVLKSHTEAVNEVIEVGDVAFEDKVYGEAVKYYALAVEKDRKNALAHEKLGQLFQEQGKVDKAIMEWKKSLSLKPDNDALRKKLFEARVKHRGK